MSSVKFELGRTVITPAARDALGEDMGKVLHLLARHARGDWGDLCKNDVDANEIALRAELRLFSSYKLSSDLVIWIITEADRSVTTVLLPSDY